MNELTVVTRGFSQAEARVRAMQARIAHNHDAALRAYTRVVVRAERAYARKEHPGRRRGNRLAKGIRALPGVPGQTRRIKATGRLAHLVLAPVAAHEIEASKHRALKLPDGRFARRVQHPATPGDPFLRRVQAGAHPAALAAAREVLLHGL